MQKNDDENAHPMARVAGHTHETVSCTHRVDGVVCWSQPKAQSTFVVKSLMTQVSLHFTQSGRWAGRLENAPLVRFSANGAAQLQGCLFVPEQACSMKLGRTIRCLWQFITIVCYLSRTNRSWRCMSVEGVVSWEYSGVNRGYSRHIVSAIISGSECMPSLWRQACNHMRAAI